MAIVPPDDWVVAEMITHDFVWQGAGASCDEAREALLSAWTAHRRSVLQRQPGLAPTLPEAGQMPQHFRIVYRCYQRGVGYRDGEPIRS